MSSIQVNNLIVSYKNKSKEVVLNIPELKLQKGSLNGLFGPNYIGKSTFLKVLAQVTSKLSIQGQILYDNTKFNPIKNSPRILYVPQDYYSSVFPWFTIKENIRVISKAIGLSLKEIDEQVHNFSNELGYDNEIHLLKSLGFYNKEKLKTANQLSGGQLQVLSVIRALVTKPDILIMDEPFSALDIYKGKRFRDKIKTYIEKKSITTIIVGHELEEIIEFTNTLFFLGKNKNNEGVILGSENSNIQIEDIETFSKELKTKYQIA